MSIIADTNNGQLRIQGNEVIIDAKDADASKFRVGSRSVPGESGGGGAYSFDIIQEVQEGSPRIEAVVMVGGKSHTGGGELGICIWDGTEPITDASQKKVVEFRDNEIEFKVPVKGLQCNCSGGSGSVLQSPNGRVLLAAQDDGNLVLYVDGAPVKALFGLPPDQLW